MGSTPCLIRCTTGARRRSPASPCRRHGSIFRISRPLRSNQMYHAVGLIVAGLLSSQGSSRSIRIAGYAFVIGTVLFSRIALRSRLDRHDMAGSDRTVWRDGIHHWLVCPGSSDVSVRLLELRQCLIEKPRPPLPGCCRARASDLCQLALKGVLRNELTHRWKSRHPPIPVVPSIPATVWNTCRTVFCRYGPAARQARRNFLSGVGC